MGKTADSIEMPSGVVYRVRPGNDELDAVISPAARKVAAGLGSHWPRVTDLRLETYTGSRPNEARKILMRFGTLYLNGTTCIDCFSLFYDRCGSRTHVLSIVAQC